jgi:hypothetical protein
MVEFLMTPTMKMKVNGFFKHFKGSHTDSEEGNDIHENIFYETKREKQHTHLLCHLIETLVARMYFWSSGR